MQFLDALRGVAVLLVVLSHFGEGHSEFLRDLISSTFQFGQAGVSLFFLISGYIIPRSINGASSLGVFGGTASCGCILFIGYRSPLPCS
ncbi:acyltransferase family protein (plasmid) [Cupriavidus necator]|nr:acyltransferase family protein [Cupriavidus necator]